LVKSNPGDIIKPGDLRSITGEGMPMKGNPFHKGDLYILFNVKFPVPGTIKPAQVGVRRPSPSCFNYLSIVDSYSL